MHKRAEFLVDRIGVLHLRVTATRGCTILMRKLEDRSTIVRANRHRVRSICTKLACPPHLSWKRENTLPSCRSIVMLLIQINHGFSGDFPMNASASLTADRMSNIYNNSVVRFYHHVFHDLSGKLALRETYYVPKMTLMIGL